MKTPFTDASTLFVSIHGNIFPVVAAEVARLLEIKLHAAMRSQEAAWNVIRQADWKSETPSWRKAAMDWQEQMYVQPELAINFPPQIHHNSNPPKNYQEALEQVARLEFKLRQAEKHLADAEQLENQMIAKLQNLENEITSRTSFGTN